MANKTVKFTIQVTDNGTMKEVEINAEELQGALKDVGTASSKTTGSVSALGGALKKYLAVGAIVAGLKKAVDKIAEFERANSELASVLGTTLDGVESLTQSASELGRTTEFTASEVTSLQTALARLGFNSGQIQDMQEPVLKFAAAVGTDLASAADFAGSALRSFGLSSSDTGNLLDIMAASTSKSALSFSKLQTSISTVGPVANAFGLTASEVTSLLGVLSNAGFDASSAATALRNILLNLADSNGKLASGLGYSAKTMPEIINALKDLRDKGVDLNSTLEMTDKRSVAAFNALIKGADDVAALNEQLHNADGALSDMYTTMTDNVIGATRALQSAWEGFVLAFQNSRGPIKEVIQLLADGINLITDTMDAAQTGGKSSRQKKDTESLWDRFKAIGQGQGKEEMIRQYNQWVNDAESAYDKAIDAFNAHKTRKNRQAMNEAGNYVMNLTDIWDRVNTFGDSGPMISSGGPVDALEDISTGAGQAADDFAAYRDAVKAAAQVNDIFAGGVDSVGVQLKTMRQGITGLIAKYGAEDSRVKELISEYRKLSASRMMMDTPLEKVSVGFDTSMSAGITDAIAEYRRNIESAVKMNNIFGQSGSELETRLSAMKDGILDLITTYGLYNEEVQKLIEEYKKLRLSGESYNGTAKTVNSSGNTTVEIFNGVSSVFSAMNGLIGESASSWTSWVATLLGSIAQAIPAITTLIAATNAKTAAETAAAVAGGASAVAPIPIVGPGLAVAASATLLATILGAIASIPKFANGGIAYGPTLGLFGEYSGAANNPEVVAPLDKLRDIIGVTDNGGPRMPVKFRIEGRDLVAIYDIEKQRKTRVG